MCKEWRGIIMYSEENSMVMVRQVKHEEFVYTQNSRGEAVLAAKKADTENIIKTMKLDGKNTEKAITTMANSGDSSYGCCIY